MLKRVSFLLTIAAAAVAASATVFAQDLPLDRLTLPPGFSIEVYASGIENPRQMALSPSGTLFVSTRRAGNVYAVLDTDTDQIADRVVTIAGGLTMPNGVAFRDGDLYVAEINRVLRFDDVESHLESPPEPVVINDGLPTERSHGWKYLGFGPDGKLYVPIGAPCNICDRTGEDPRFGTIVRMNPDGTGEEIFARGIRNSVGFDWQPGTDELWFTNNGRDRLGDEMPPDTLHHAPEAGLHFGYPFCHGGDFQDPEFDDRPCAEFEPPARKLGPHVASIGMKFYTGSMFPPEYHNQIFIAEHGSWNRSSEAGHTGYRLTVVHVDGDRAGEYDTFVDGWLGSDNEWWGRPADVVVMPDGSLLVSDDTANAIYRITYDG